MIIVLGEVRVDPSALDDFKWAVGEVEAETRKESGCIHYAFGQDVATPTQFWLSESWFDQASLDAHGRTAHIAKFRATIAKLKVELFVVKRYEAGVGIVMINNRR